MRLFLLCPGRGSYGRNELGSLHTPSATLDRLDAIRSGLGRPTLRDLDAADRFSARLHLAGEHASLLTSGATLADLELLDADRARIVAVGGNSMGWYTALHAAGALDLDAMATLVETFAGYQVDNVIGGQVLYPQVDEDWRRDSTLEAVVQDALRLPGVELSIRLGGSVVLAGDDAAVRSLLQELPKLRRGRQEYPQRLPFHSAFHTSLLARASERAVHELAGLPFRAPSRPLVDGTGRVHRAHADPEELRRYTLTTQVTETFDLTACLRVGLGEYGPDAVLLPGPGGSLGSAVAQVMIAIGWRGLRDRQDFAEAQAADQPLLISMNRPEQRALVV